MSWALEWLGEATAVVDLPMIVGKQRPKASVVKGHARFYTPRKTVDFEERIRQAWLVQVGDEWEGFDGPVEVDVSVSRELAKSNPKRWAGRSDTAKPDIDNVLKAVLDALNGVAYEDDSHVFGAVIEKVPRTAHGSGNQITIRCNYYLETYGEES